MKGIGLFHLVLGALLDSIHHVLRPYQNIQYKRQINVKCERDIINNVWSMCRAAEWKGNWNVTYWRHKDSAPPPKLSGLSSLCKPQGESEYSSRYTPGRLEVPAPQTSTFLLQIMRLSCARATLLFLFIDYPQFVLILI